MYLSQDLGPKQAKFDCPKRALNCGESVEPMTGIEPAYSAWEVGQKRARRFIEVRSRPYELGKQFEEVQVSSHEFETLSDIAVTPVRRADRGSICPLYCHMSCNCHEL